MSVTELINHVRKYDGAKFGGKGVETWHQVEGWRDGINGMPLFQSLEPPLD